MSGRTTSSAETFVPELLVLTERAATKAKFLINEENNTSLMLRVFITGGGCSGFQYGFSFDETLNEDDTVIEKHGVKLVVDPMSLQYLTGSEIDYQEELAGSRFVVNNPHATTTCGCGASFSL